MSGKLMLGEESAVSVLLAGIAEKADPAKSWTSPERCAAVAVILKGIVDWLTDQCTIQAGIVEDLARAIGKCNDSEELRDLSVRVREMAIRYEPDAGRVAMTELELRVLNLLDVRAGTQGGGG